MPSLHAVHTLEQLQADTRILLERLGTVSPSTGSRAHVRDDRLMHGRSCAPARTGPPPEPDTVEACKARDHRDVNRVANDVNPGVQERERERERAFEPSAKRIRYAGKRSTCILHAWSASHMNPAPGPHACMHGLILRRVHRSTQGVPGGGVLANVQHPCPSFGPVALGCSVGAPAQ